MDAVPLIFVDTVVQLFGEPTLEPLARSVNNTIWKDVIDLHFRNRRYYNVMFKKVEDRFHVGFLGSDRFEPIEVVQKVNRRFLRFSRVSHCHSSIVIDQPLALQEGEQGKLRRILSPQFIDADSWLIISLEIHSSTTDSEEVTILEITEIGDFLKKMAWEVLGLWSLFGDDFDEEMLVKKVDGGRGSSVKAVH
ncbi:hypothetical protein QR680_007633 [Steinernema hermaphroditum]|uniref:Uncharacterized protein n=1 Tax=Steinernema hermaphroditum TaxID=289476 RepID=A0AA39IFZ6_9BILA|nr:hypothetical protein QR680_007633 [Steinernema hermaphroditum]